MICGLCSGRVARGPLYNFCTECQAINPPEPCVHIYRDAHCGATSDLPDCNKSLKACRERDNVERIGMFPRIPGRPR